MRAVIYRFASPECALEFELFPMIHVAAPGFYDSVRQRLKECDVVLYEGVSGARTAIATLSYRWMARRARLLVEAPLWQRLAVYVGAPLLGVYRYLTATRTSIARSLEVTDLSPEDRLPPRGRSRRPVRCDPWQTRWASDRVRPAPPS